MNELERNNYIKIAEGILYTAKRGGYVLPFSEIAIYKMDLLFGEYRAWLDSVIFSHEFAKAVWGEHKILEEYPLSDGSGEYLKIYMPAYHAHLRRLVIEPTIEKRLDYLRDFIIR